MSNPSAESTPPPSGPAADAAVDAPTGHSEVGPPAWVERGRSGLRVAALIAGLASIALTIVLVVLVALGAGPADNVIDGFASWLTDTLIFFAPATVAIALNLLVWRALLRPLARMGVGARVGIILLMVGVLGAISVILVAVLLFGGFLAFGVLGVGF